MNQDLMEMSKRLSFLEELVLQNQKVPILEQNEEDNNPIRYNSTHLEFRFRKNTQYLTMLSIFWQYAVSKLPEELWIKLNAIEANILKLISEDVIYSHFNFLHSYEGEGKNSLDEATSKEIIRIAFEYLEMSFLYSYELNAKRNKYLANIIFLVSQIDDNAKSEALKWLSYFEKSQNEDMIGRSMKALFNFISPIFSDLNSNNFKFFYFESFQGQNDAFTYDPEWHLREWELEKEREADAFFGSGMSVKEWQDYQSNKLWEEIKKNREKDKN